MAKRILVPIDFSIESLKTLKTALHDLHDTKADIILMYAEYTSSSISALLFYSPEKRLQVLLKPEFKEALTILKNRYEGVIDTISIDFFHGYGVTAFKNYVEGNQIDTIYLPKQYTLRPLADGFNPVPIIKKSKLPYREADWTPSTRTSQEEQLSQLFNAQTA